MSLNEDEKKNDDEELSETEKRSSMPVSALSQSRVLPADEEASIASDPIEGRVRMNSTIQGRMMKNMLRGEAASLSECIMVVVAGQLLAFNSEFTKGVCLSGLLL